MKEFVNAKILSADIDISNGIVEHVMVLQTKFGNFEFGRGRMISRIAKFKEDTELGNYAGYYIARMMQVIGVTKFSELKGQACQMVVEDQQVIGICSLFDQEVAFYPNDDLKDLMPESQEPSTGDGEDKEAYDVIEPEQVTE